MKRILILLAVAFLPSTSFALTFADNAEASQYCSDYQFLGSYDRPVECSIVGETSGKQIMKLEAFNPPDSSNPDAIVATESHYILGESCSTDNIPGKNIMSGAPGSDGSIIVGYSSGYYNVSGCEYYCRTDFTKFDGQTSVADAQVCTGTGQLFVEDRSQVPTREDFEDNNPESCYTDVQNVPNCTYVDTTPDESSSEEPTTEEPTTEEPTTDNPEGGTTDGNDTGTDTDGTTDGGDGAGGGTSGGGGGTSGGDGTGGTDGDPTDGTGDGTDGATEEFNPGQLSGLTGPSSWYESKYPDGVSGVVSNFQETVSQGPFLAILDPLKSLPDQGSYPTWNFDANMGSLGNYSGTISVPDYVWIFVRFCILFTAAMTARKLIFGG